MAAAVSNLVLLVLLVAGPNALAVRVSGAEGNAVANTTKSATPTGSSKTVTVNVAHEPLCRSSDPLSYGSVQDVYAIHIGNCAETEHKMLKCDCQRAADDKDLSGTPATTIQLRCSLVAILVLSSKF